MSEAAAAVPVAVTGITWTTIGIGLLNLLAGGALVALIRAWPTLKKIANEREASLLKERAADMEAMRERIELLENKLEQKDKIHEAERSLDRHRINNLTQCLDSLLLLLDAAPAKAAAAVAKIKEMRADQMKAEALEKAAIQAAIVTANGDRHEH